MIDRKKHILEYVDSMMIIDKNYNIIYTNRFNSRYGSGVTGNEYLEYINKQYFEVYPELHQEESTMVEALQYGRVIIREGQTFSDTLGRVYTTNNITFPIIRFGEVIGAMELSQDITSVGDLTLKGKKDRKEVSGKPSKIFDELVTFDDIVTCNSDMLESIRKAKKFALEDNPILIFGETGTGKEMFVEAMVNVDERRKDKFVAQNCAAIPETLFESILFGSVKGAFTGAENRMGLFEMADGGVLFLDELNSMPLGLQAKLLRVLQNGKIRPVGSAQEKRVDVKVIAAMNKNPMMLIKENILREDLFYRLSSSTLYLVPLRDRKEDIPLYMDCFLEQFNRKYGKHISKLSSSIKMMIHEYHWPGNVRELRHVVESMVNLSEESVLTTKSLPAYLKEVLDMNGNAASKRNNLDRILNPSIPLKDKLEKVEKEYIIDTLITCNGNVTKAAEMLDMPRQTLKFRMDRLKIGSFKKSKR